MPKWQGWLPWIVVSVVVILWTNFGIFNIGAVAIPWPGLHNQIAITLYNDKPYAAVWTFQPLATGTAILVSAIITAALVGVGPGRFITAACVTWKQSRIAILTVALIVALAYLMNYSGMTYTLGKAVASMGYIFPLVSPFLGWVAVFLSGSDTSGNALFGNLQVVAANQLGLNPVLIAATNSSGGVMGKMISPQNIATACLGDRPEGAGGRGLRPHLQAQRCADVAAGAAGSASTVCLPLDDSLRGVGRRGLRRPKPSISPPARRIGGNTSRAPEPGVASLKIGRRVRACLYPD